MIAIAITPQEQDMVLPVTTSSKISMAETHKRALAIIDTFGPREFSAWEVAGSLITDVIESVKHYCQKEGLEFEDFRKKILTFYRGAVVHLLNAEMYEGQPDIELPDGRKFLHFSRTGDQERDIVHIDDAEANDEHRTLHNERQLWIMAKERRGDLEAA